MRKLTCGQCSNHKGLQESMLPVWTKSGRVKVVPAVLCVECRDQARRTIARATRHRWLAI